MCADLKRLGGRAGGTAGTKYHITRCDPLLAALACGPDADLRLQFEALGQFDAEDKNLALGVLEGLILKHQAKQSQLRQAARSTPIPAKTISGAKRKARTATNR